MVVGAVALFLMGAASGWFLRGVRPDADPPAPLQCPCGHSQSFHVDGKGKCAWMGDPYHRTGVGVIHPKCSCLAYLGPRPEAPNDARTAP